MAGRLHLLLEERGATSVGLQFDHLRAGRAACSSKPSSFSRRSISLRVATFASRSAGRKKRDRPVVAATLRGPARAPRRPPRARPATGWNHAGRAQSSASERARSVFRVTALHRRQPAKIRAANSSSGIGCEPVRTKRGGRCWRKSSFNGVSSLRTGFRIESGSLPRKPSRRSTMWSRAELFIAGRSSRAT